MTRFDRLVLLALALLAGAIGYAVFAIDGEASHCAQTNGVMVVDLDNRKHRHVLDHVWDATRAGQPKRLHIARYEADDNRRASLRGVPSKPGWDRDEYPPAMSDEGGQGASVRYVRPAENRSAGSVMGNQLEAFCNNQRFRFERRPR